MVFDADAKEDDDNSEEDDDGRGGYGVTASLFCPSFVSLMAAETACVPSA